MERDNLGRPKCNRYGAVIKYGMPEGEKGPGFNHRLHGTITERSAYITRDGLRVGIITERMNDATETEYVIQVLWESYLNADITATITGIDMEIYPREYYIRDHIPGFMRMRLIPEGRPDLAYYLKEYGLDCYDKFEFMCRNGGQSGPDRFRVERIT
jgi:hypothetical protein